MEFRRNKGAVSSGADGSFFTYYGVGHLAVVGLSDPQCFSLAADAACAVASRLLPFSSRPSYRRR